MGAVCTTPGSVLSTLLCCANGVPSRLCSMPEVLETYGTCDPTILCRDRRSLLPLILPYTAESLVATSRLAVVDAHPPTRPGRLFVLPLCALLLPWPLLLIACHVLHSGYLYGLGSC
jgi:hypothetical protein